MTANPNAKVAGGTSIVGLVVVWLLGHFHVALSAEAAVAVAGAATTVVLFVGRNGVKGLIDKIWRGSGA